MLFSPDEIVRDVCAGRAVILPLTGR